MTLISVFIGGGLGSLARYGLSRLCATQTFTSLSMGTFLANLAGSALIGFFFVLFQAVALPASLRFFVTVGFLGGFTTFSTFMLETWLLVGRKDYSSAALNFALHNVLGFAAVAAGIFAMNLLRGVPSASAFRPYWPS